MGFKPSHEEDKWAKQLELDLKRELHDSFSEEELEDLRELHWNKCPKDGIDLVQLEINGTGIRVEKCLVCGGIWVDRIDLERLLQSSKKPKTMLKLLAKTLGTEIPSLEE